MLSSATSHALTNGRRYYFRVIAVNVAGKSPPSNVPGGTTVPATGNCTTTANIPGGRDPWGGCWPGPSNTGVPSGVTLSAYTGPCRITTPNYVIDRRVVNCKLDIVASGVVISRSVVNGQINISSGSARISDSYVNSSPTGTERDVAIKGPNVTVLRVEIVGGQLGVYCGHNCIVRDSWTHGRIIQDAGTRRDPHDPQLDDRPQHDSL